MHKRSFSGEKRTTNGERDERRLQAARERATDYWRLWRLERVESGEGKVRLQATVTGKQKEKDLTLQWNPTPFPNPFRQFPVLLHRQQIVRRRNPPVIVIFPGKKKKRFKKKFREESEENHSLKFFIPVRILRTTKKEFAEFLKNVSEQVPNLHVTDVDLPLSELCNDNERLEQVALDREFHISLGRTVDIKGHRVNPLLSRLRGKLEAYKNFWIGFDKWEVFVNDDNTRTFLSMEITCAGKPEITEQIGVLDEVYQHNNLPVIQKKPRPHISLAWAPGDIRDLLQSVVAEEVKKKAGVGGFCYRLFAAKFGGIECKIGDETISDICKIKLKEEWER